MNPCLCEEHNNKELENTSACFDRSWMFTGMTAAEEEALASNVVSARYRPGQMIFRQGEPAQNVFLIRSGRVRLGKAMDDGTEVTLDIRRPGDYMGEYVLDADLKFPVSAWCMDEVIVCGFTREQFERLVMEMPAIGLAVIKNLARRVLSLGQRVDALSQMRLEDKVHGVLVQAAREHGEKEGDGYVVRLGLTHAELGFLVGAHRVSVTRAMKKLKNSGRIIQKDRTFIVNGS
ncbi:MAG: Crp/Fnr family transcriptional regulator [Candidatus Adiutrix sp.]|jgi:CRP/FNR family transcriptional regulator|nr:Crp/Fnr family transcriptional regulator [Candidatus Adiutrix sp.]